MKRYQLICVAPDVSSGGSYDDPDEAILACDGHHDVYDRETGQYLTPTCPEDVEDARVRLQAKRATSA